MSTEQIALKKAQIEGVLVPFPLVWYFTTLQDLGFVDVEVLHGTNMVDAVKAVDKRIFLVYTSVGDADKTGPAVQHFVAKARVERYLAQTLKAAVYAPEVLPRLLAPALRGVAMVTCVVRSPAGFYPSLQLHQFPAMHSYGRGVGRVAGGTVPAAHGCWSPSVHQCPSGQRIFSPEMQ